MSNFTAKIIGQLDTSQIERQIKNIEKTHRLKLVVDDLNVGGIAKQMQNAGASAGNSFVSSFNSALGKINVSNSKAAIEQMRNSLQSLNMSKSSIDLITQDLKEMDVTVTKVAAKMSGRGLNLTVSGVDSMGRAVNVVKQFNQETGKISTISQGFSASIKKASTSTDKLASSLKASTLNNKMTTWLSKNSKASKEFGGAISQLSNKLMTLNSTGKLTESELNNIEKEFKQIQQAAIQAGKTGASFGLSMKSAFASITRYVGVSTIIYQSIAALKEMFNNVVAIDTEMTELKKVTDETSASYNKFLSNAGSTAKEIGTTVTGIISSTADFARLGYSFEDSQELAKVANIYAVVGDEIESVDVATKSIISTLAAYKSEISNTMQIVDKFNEVGNNFAISSGGIGDALQRSASALSAANNTLDQSIALITAANTVVQDPDSVGTAFKTISMRIRGATTELEAAGLETDGMAASTAELRKEILALSGVDIMLDENTFKSTYDIMDELAQKWQDLTDIEQATITELIAGKRQGNVVSSLMNNFDVARKVLETSENSDGSATKEHEKYLDSLEAKLNQLTAAWQELSQAFLDSDFLKGLVDVGTGILSVLTDIIDTVGVLPTLIASVVAVMSFKKIGKDKMFSFCVNMPMSIYFLLDIIVLI